MSTENYLKPSYLTRIRGIPLLPEERLNCAFTPDEGLASEPSSSGRLLVATNRRMISFSSNQHSEETVLVPLEEISGVVIKGEGRNTGSLMQGLVLVAVGILIYLVSGYWLANQLKGPNIPFLNIDVWALLILAALVWGGWLVGRHYFTKDLGQVTFQGSNWAFSFPFTGEKPRAEVHQVVQTAFLHRDRHSTQTE